MPSPAPTGSTCSSAAASGSASASRPSAPMRVALRDPPGEVTAGPLDWRAIAPGFEVGELAVVVDGSEVDRILLARIDPARFRFAVRNAPAGNRDLDAWMRDLGAAL